MSGLRLVLYKFDVPDLVPLSLRCTVVDSGAVRCSDEIFYITSYTILDDFEIFVFLQ